MGLTTGLKINKAKEGAYFDPILGKLRTKDSGGFETTSYSTESVLQPDESQQLKTLFGASLKGEGDAKPTGETLLDEYRNAKDSDADLIYKGCADFCRQFYQIDRDGSYIRDTFAFYFPLDFLSAYDTERSLNTLFYPFCTGDTVEEKTDKQGEVMVNVSPRNFTLSDIIGDTPDVAQQTEWIGYNFYGSLVIGFIDGISGNVQWANEKVLQAIWQAVRSLNLQVLVGDSELYGRFSLHLTQEINLSHLVDNEKGILMSIYSGFMGVNVFVLSKFDSEEEVNSTIHSPQGCATVPQSVFVIIGKTGISHVLNLLA